jgi:hypothetical protein
VSYRPPTEAEAAEMIADAYRQGLDATYTDEDGTDFERLLRLYEVGEIDLGNDAGSPLIRRIKSAYRSGLRG